MGPQADAQATFEAFKELAEVVKASPEKAVAPVAAPSLDGPVGAAAKKLADASYPMLQKIDWAATGVLDKYVTNTPASKEGISALLDADPGRNAGPLGCGKCGGWPALDTACAARGSHGCHRQADCLRPACQDQGGLRHRAECAGPER